VSQPKFKIVLARLVDDTELVRERRTDLGERPVMRDIKTAQALMWLNRGTAEDIEKAKRYAPTEGYTVLVYETTERDPLGRAKRDISRAKNG
jgi:hypothetical protein